MTTIDLFNNKVGDAGLASLLKIKARRLNVGFNKLTNNGAVLLSKVLE